MNKVAKLPGVPVGGASAAEGSTVPSAPIVSYAGRAVVSVGIEEMSEDTALSALGVVPLTAAASASSPQLLFSSALSA